MNLTTRNAFQLPPYPSGWFVICLSEDLKVGDIKNEIFCGEEVVVFRTANGRAVVMEAYCPHMGAHFGHGGKGRGRKHRMSFSRVLF